MDTIPASVLRPDCMTGQPTPLRVASKRTLVHGLADEEFSFLKELDAVESTESPDEEPFTSSPPTTMESGCWEGDWRVSPIHYSPLLAKQRPFQANDCARHEQSSDNRHEPSNRQRNLKGLLTRGISPIDMRMEMRETPSRCTPQMWR